MGLLKTLVSGLNETGIPKFFWYCLAVCMVGCFSGLMYLGFKSQSVNIEVASTKIQLISTIKEVEDASDAIKKKEDAMTARDAALEQENKELKRQLAAAGRPVVSPATQPSLPKPVEIPIDRKALEEKISNLKNTRQIYEQSAK